MASAVDEFDPQDDLPMAVATMDHSEEFLDPNLGGDNEALGSLRDNRSFEPAPSNMEVADEPATVDVQADASALIERIKQAARLKRQRTLDDRLHLKREIAEAGLRQVIKAMPVTTETDVNSTAGINRLLARGAVHIGAQYLMQGWQHADQWPREFMPAPVPLLAPFRLERDESVSEGTPSGSGDGSAQAIDGTRRLHGAGGALSAARGADGAPRCDGGISATQPQFAGTLELSTDAHTAKAGGLEGGDSDAWSPDGDDDCAPRIAESPDEKEVESILAEWKSMWRASGGDAAATFPTRSQSVAAEAQRQQTPPDRFFSHLHLRVAIASGAGAMRMHTFSLPPTARTLPALVGAASRCVGVDESAVDGVLKLPDVLLADDEDVLWLSEGAELRLLLAGETSGEQLPACEASAAALRFPVAALTAFPALAEELPVTALPGRNRLGWVAALVQAWRVSLLSHGWGQWSKMELALGVPADEVHAFSLGWLRALLSAELSRPSGARAAASRHAQSSRASTPTGASSNHDDAGSAHATSRAHGHACGAHGRTLSPMQLSPSHTHASPTLSAAADAALRMPPPWLPRGGDASPNADGDAGCSAASSPIPSRASPVHWAADGESGDRLEARGGLSAAALRWLLSVSSPARSVDAAALREMKQLPTAQANAKSKTPDAPPQCKWLERLVSMQLLRSFVKRQLESAAQPAGAPRVSEPPPEGWGGAKDDMKLLLGADKHGAGQMQALRHDASLRLSSPQLWIRPETAKLLRRRQHLLLHALLRLPWADDDLLLNCTRLRPLCALRCDWLPSMTARASCVRVRRSLAERAVSLRVRTAAQGTSVLTSAADSSAQSVPFVNILAQMEGLGLSKLSREVCRALGVETSASTVTLLKLPDVVLVDDDDVAALQDGDEIELLLGAGGGHGGGHGTTGGDGVADSAGETLRLQIGALLALDHSLLLRVISAARHQLTAEVPHLQADARASGIGLPHSQLPPLELQLPRWWRSPEHEVALLRGLHVYAARRDAYAWVFGDARLPFRALASAYTNINLAEFFPSRAVCDALVQRCLLAAALVNSVEYEHDDAGEMENCR